MNQEANEFILRGGQFIVTETPAESVFTLEDLSEEQKMMRESTQEFVDRELWAHWQRFEKKDYQFTEEAMKKAAELGLLGIAVPEQYGGMGMGFVSTMLVCDYISGATGSFSTAFGAHTGIGTMPITLYGTEEQKMKYVPKLASGEWFGAYCLTEPTAGSDANSGKTKAVPPCCARASSQSRTVPLGGVVWLRITCQPRPSSRQIYPQAQARARGFRERS